MITASGSRSTRIVYCRFEAQNFLEESIAALFKPATIFNGTEQDAALASGLTLGATAAAFGSSTGGHGKCRYGVAGGKEGDELSVAISDGIAAFLL